MRGKKSLCDDRLSPNSLIRACYYWEKNCSKPPQPLTTYTIKGKLTGTTSFRLVKLPLKSLFLY